MHSFKSLSKTHVALSAAKAEDLEVTARTVVEATSWMVWWIFFAKSLDLSSSEDEAPFCLWFLLSAAGGEDSFCHLG